MHVVAVLYLINQKGFKVQCRKLAKAMDKLAGTLENLQKPNGPNGVSSKKDQEAHKLELAHTQEMLKEAWKAHNKAVAKMHELLRNLLSSDLQSQWDQICCKIHKRDLLAGLNGQMTTGRRPHLWTASQDCLELQTKLRSMLLYLDLFLYVFTSTYVPTVPA